VLAFITTDTWGPYLWGLFLVQRFLQIALFTTSLTYAADSIPASKRTQGLAIFGLTGLIPIAVGGYIGDIVIEFFGFGGLFVVAAASATISWSLVWRLPVLPVRARQPRRGFWAAFGQKNLLPLWLASLCFSIGFEALFTFTRTFVDERQIGTTGLFFGVYGLTAAGTRIFGGSRYDYLPQRALTVGSIMTYGLSVALLGSTRSIGMFVLAAAAAGAAHGAVFPILSSQVVARARTAERGSAMSIFTSIFDVALLTAGPIAGVMIDASGYTLAFSVVGVGLVIGAVGYGIWDTHMTANAQSDGISA
jgi:predicted MFS family arabinose efflux permease